MGSFYYFIRNFLNKILSLRKENLINTDDFKINTDSICTKSKAKFNINSILNSSKQIKKNFQIKDVFFLSNLLNLENAFIKYSNTLFIKNHKLYNKGRYSRNKQIYRTGVIWCLWLTVIALAGPFYYFYSFTFNFTYLWVFFFIFIIKFIYNYAAKHNYINTWKFFDYAHKFFQNSK